MGNLKKRLINLNFWLDSTEEKIFEEIYKVNVKDAKRNVENGEGVRFIIEECVPDCIEKIFEETIPSGQASEYLNEKLSKELSRLGKKCKGDAYVEIYDDYEVALVIE